MNMHLIVFCVFSILVLREFKTCAGQATNNVIFQPSAIFDPFVEKGPRDNRRSATVNQPNLAFGLSTIPNQSIRLQPRPPSAVGYPRAIGHRSGGADELLTQLWHPNTFFNNAQQGPAATNQGKIVNAPRKLPIPQYGSPVGLNTFVNNQQRNIVPVTERIVSHVPYSYPNVQSSFAQGQLAKPIHVRGPPSDIVEEASILAEKFKEFEGYPAYTGSSNSDGGGHSHEIGFHKSHGNKEAKGYESSHHHGAGDHEKHNKHHRKAHHQEKGGHDNADHDEAEHYKNHHEGKKSHRKAKFGEKKGHKRGHKTKGFHNKFHKDEYHREHRFYDDYNKEGYHEKHGKGHAHYKNSEGGYKKGGNHKSGKQSKKFGKKELADKGKFEDEKKGFSKKGGKEEHHNHHEDYHKKQGKIKGKEYGYQKKH